MVNDASSLMVPYTATRGDNQWIIDRRRGHPCSIYRSFISWTSNKDGYPFYNEIINLYDMKYCISRHIKRNSKTKQQSEID